jgi:hypothetical protein
MVLHAGSAFRPRVILDSASALDPSGRAAFSRATARIGYGRQHSLIAAPPCPLPPTEHHRALDLLLRPALIGGGF